MNLILSIAKLLCHGLVPDGVVKLGKKWKLALRVLLKVLDLKSRLNSQVLVLYCFINYLRYTKPLGPIQIYFTLCDIRILLEGLLLNT